jgi:hypothetical protein
MLNGGCCFIDSWFVLKVQLEGSVKALRLGDLAWEGASQNLP